MTSILRREHAPFAPEAWKEIDAEATRILKGNLSARTVVDVDGPHGWEFSSVNLGRVEMKEPRGSGGVNWGLRNVLPLVELRAPFTLSQWEMDNIPRGAADPDLDPVIRAAQQTALFEENLVYQGLAGAGVAGILKASPHAAVALGTGGGSMVTALDAAVLKLQQNAVGGPYNLVLDATSHTQFAAGDTNGYPVRSRIRDLLEGGKVLWSPAMKNGGALISSRGGDYELVLGQDLSIGFLAQEGDKVHLYLTETVTFRINNPAAAVALKASK